ERRIIIKDENGSVHCFKEDLAALMAGGYTLRIEASALDCPATRLEFNLRFTNGEKWPVMLDPKSEQSVKESPKPTQAKEELTEDEIKILRCLGDQDHPVIAPSISSVTKISLNKTKYCLTELYTKQYNGVNIDELA